MVGGPSPLAQDERLLNFTFPERPGALLKFLSSMQPGWNISLFHYRNQGADYGRTLIGMQVPKRDNKAFKQFLSDLGSPQGRDRQPGLPALSAPAPVSADGPEAAGALTAASRRPAPGTA